MTYTITLYSYNKKNWFDSLGKAKEWHHDLMNNYSGTIVPFSSYPHHYWIETEDMNQE